MVSKSKEDGETTTTITASTTIHLTPSKPLSYNELNPVSAPTEFYGPLGVSVVLFFTPLMVYVLFYTCNEVTGCSPTTSSGWSVLWEMNKENSWPDVAGRFWDWETVVVYMGYYLYLIACWVIIPTERIEGTVLRDGRRNKYKMNGMSFFLFPFPFLSFQINTSPLLKTLRGSSKPPHGDFYTCNTDEMSRYTNTLIDFRINLRLSIEPRRCRTFNLALSSLGTIMFSNISFRFLSSCIFPN